MTKNVCQNDKKNLCQNESKVSVKMSQTSLSDESSLNKCQNELKNSVSDESKVLIKMSVGPSSYLIFCSSLSQNLAGPTPARSPQPHSTRAGISTYRRNLSLTWRAAFYRNSSAKEVTFDPSYLLPFHEFSHFFFQSQKIRAIIQERINALILFEYC